MITNRLTKLFTVLVTVMMIITMAPRSAFANELDEYRYYYESTNMSSYDVGNTIGISEEETLLGYLCFLCNGSTYNFTWDKSYPIKVPNTEGAIGWNANITGKKLTIRDTSNNEVYTDELSGNNNAWKIRVEWVNEDDPSQSFLTWEPASVPTYTVTYNKNTEDSVDGLSSTTAVVPKDTNPGQYGYTAEFYTKLPSLSRTGYTFEGWYTEASSGTKVGGGGQNYLPKGDITLYAHWKGTGAYVSIDFGEGHEDYVQSKFGSIDGFTVDDAKLKYEVSDRADIAEARQTFMDTLDFSDDVDDGELFMNDVALHPVNYYADDDARREEYTEYEEAMPSSGLTLYAQWAKPVGPVSVKITPPAVGTEVKVIDKWAATERTDPQVEATVTGNAVLDTVSARDWTNSSYKGYFEGTVKDGQNCFARIHIDAKYGYYFAYVDGEGYTWAEGTSVTGTNASGVKVTPDHEYGAQFCGMVWAGSGTEPAIYDVKVDENIENGTVEAYPVTAHEGDTIEVTAKPKEGYVLKAVTWTPKGGKAVSIDAPDGSGGTFSFEMPAADVTVSATFDKVNMVYVDFGKGHEDFVQSMYSGVEDYTINGSVVSFQCGTGEDVKADEAYYTFNIAPSQAIDPADDGVSYMYDIALSTRENYADEAALNVEQASYNKKPIHDGITFYALWADPVKATVTITPPECGTEVTLKYKAGIYVQAQPAPEMTVEGNCSFNDYQMFFNSWDLSEYGVTSEGQSLTMTGDNTYTATGYLGSDWGYYMPADKDAVTIKGGTLKAFDTHGSYSAGLEISVAVEHKWDSGKVTKEASTTSTGVKTYTCSKCGATKTETIPKKPSEDESSDESSGETTKTVSGTLLAKMTAKGGSSLIISWTKVSNVDGYDVFFSKCGEDNKVKLAKTIKGNKTFKWTKKSLKKKTGYKAIVKAWVKKNGKKTYVKASPRVHAYTSGGTKKFTNPKKVTVKKTSVSLKAGKTYKIKASVTKLQKGKKLMPKGHDPKLRYVSSKKSVATVSKTGKITAKSKGSCKVYVIASNGARKTIKVTVK